MKKLKFTDNTYILLAEASEAFTLPDKINNMYLPNFLFYGGASNTFSKTDLDGNTYEVTVTDGSISCKVNNTSVAVHGTSTFYFYLDSSNHVRLYESYPATNTIPHTARDNGNIYNACFLNGVGDSLSAPTLTQGLVKLNNAESGGVVANFLTDLNQLENPLTSNYFVTRKDERTLDYFVFDVFNTGSNTTGENHSTSAGSVANSLEDFSPVIENDPYTGAGTSSTGGGDGTFDGTSDAVPIPALPSVGATDTGFISLFVPSASQLKQVASYLWGPLLDISTFKKLFEDPMDCILGLSVVPVSVPTSGNAQITVGNVELSGITLPLASQQYVEVDCGSIDFSARYFGSYLDYEPYTKMSLFVPYSGVHSVSADDIIGRTVSLKYHIDILTGSLVAFLLCGDSVLYEFNGACASNIPVNSINYASTIENAIRIAVNIGTTVATAGAAAPITGENAAARTAAREFGTNVAIAGSTAEGALSLKPSIDRAGSLGGTTGLMGNQIPYFIITRPKMCRPKNQDFFQGYPSFIQTVLGDLNGTGFTAFDTVILSKIYLTDEEKSELAAILKSGVYL